MSGVLEQFELAARELDKLTAEATSAPAAVTAEWITRAQAAMGHAQELVNTPGVVMETFSFCSEVKHYRNALLRVKEVTEKSQSHLAAQNSRLQTEHMRLKKVQNWAETVEVLT